MVTDITRRTLLKAALFGAAAPMTVLASEGKTDSHPSLIGCALEGRERYSVVVADHQGMPLSRLPLPGRGHGIAINKQRQHAVAFARRPGSYLMVFDYVSGDIVRVNTAADNRHFYGHGVYSNDGKLLFATEGERASSRGIIGVYAVDKNYQKIDELTGFGLGPHEVIIMPDDTLVIGVGGVHTDGRTPKNLDSMQPSLSYLSQSGILLEQRLLPDHHLSIRHLAHDGDKTVLCGQQYRGEPDEYPALLAMHTAGGEIELLQAEPEQWARFRHYIASIAASDKWIIATSPRGNCYGIWSKESRQLVELSSLPDASGVVAKDGRFLISSGSGAVIAQSHPRDKSSVFSSIQWDNHWSMIS